LLNAEGSVPRAAGTSYSSVDAGVGSAVLLCATAGGPHRALVSLVEQCGTTCLTLSDWSLFESAVGACHTRVALIVTESVPSRQTLDGIAALRRHAFTLIACGDGADHWSLGARSRLMLVGCAAVLDSGSIEFQTRLRTALLGALHTALVEDAETARLKQLMHGLGLIGESQTMLEIMRQLVQVSTLSDVPTLITGETGTGKELIARALHCLDPKRRGGPFVGVNAGAITSTLVESELFGHRRGAFTGADRDRRGLIRTANEGVLFLDEIGELDPSLQAKLLRVLQEGRVLGVGEDRDVSVSVRVVAATNADLPAMIQRGTFRADLFHRLNVLSLHIPPLRERPADIAPLVRHFARLHQGLAHGLRREAVVTVDPDFSAALSSLDLPGNARQLENIVRRALLHSAGRGVLGIGDLPPEVLQQLVQADEATSRQADPTQAGSRPTVRDWNLARSLAAYERSMVEAALLESGGNQAGAARLLGITPRSVYNKIHRHRLG
jgi:two-component system, NtrC family, response regulator HydG